MGNHAYIAHHVLKVNERAWLKLAREKKREHNHSLVHSDYIDVAVQEGITEDDTADTTCITTRQRRI